MNKFKCWSCHQEKRIEEFYKHPKATGGRLKRCIDCIKLYKISYREKNRERLNAYDRERARLPHRKEKSRINSRRYRKEKRLYGVRWRERNPEKRAAHCLVNNAIRSGKLVKRPCEKCGNLKVEAHHEDYTKPLEVNWLCRQCHALIHRKYL